MSYFQTCVKSHIERQWCSQPLLPYRKPLANTLIASTIPITGNLHDKTRVLMKALSMKMPGTSQHYSIQREIVVPVVEQHFQSILEANKERHHNKPLVVIGTVHLLYFLALIED